MWSIDEIIIIDLSKKKFQTNFLDTIQFFSENCFVPLTSRWRYKNLEDATTYFNYGADKIILGSGSVIQGNAIENISENFTAHNQLFKVLIVKKKMKIISQLLKVVQS